MFLLSAYGKQLYNMRVLRLVLLSSRLPGVGGGCSGGQCRCLFGIKGLQPLPGSGTFVHEYYACYAALQLKLRCARLSSPRPAPPRPLEAPF
eukprot:3413838-Pyramimonas_sp.AAC.1